MRAALASLTGTLGEPAIRHVLYRSPVTLIHFGAVLERGSPFPSRLGIAYDLPDATRQIVLDRRFRFAPFASFAPILFHEALHTGIDDDVAGLPEESVATAMEALVYMEMLLTDPSLAAIPDDLTRGSNNVMAVARFNSGPAGTDDLTLFVPDSTVPISPTAVEPLTEFYEYYATYSSPDDDSTFRDRETEGNQLLEDVLVLLAEPGVIPPDNPNFDQETLAFVDQNQGVLSPAEMIAVACILSSTSRARRRYAMDRLATRRSAMAGSIALAWVMSGWETGAQDGPDAPKPGAVPMFRGNPARTGEHPGPGPSGKPRPLWETRIGTKISTTPAVVDGVVYAGSAAPSTMAGGALHALDAATGAELWRAGTTPGDAIFSSPAVDAGVVYVGSYDGIFVAVESASGQERWRFQAEGAFFSSPAVVDDLVFCGDDAGRLYAIDVLSGAERWRLGSAEAFDRMITASPSISNGTLYIV